MAYKVTSTKEESLAQLKILISAFEKEYTIYKTPNYSEAQLRIDYINPLLKTFGWDVDNEQTKSQFLRDVMQEESIDVEESKVQGKYFLKQKKYLLILLKTINQLSKLEDMDGMEILAFQY
jgi:hypothetical protein